MDGRIVRELGTQVDPQKSRVEVDGNKIVAENLVYIVLHKPRGVVCTLSDPEGRPTIRELIKDAGARLVPVGRLDFHTSGALLCTNDGEFAQALAHPTREVPKIYVAKVKGTVDDDALERFSERIVIDGRPTQPAQVKRLRFEGDKTWLEITLREGRNRQVRRLGEATGFPVMRLARLSHAGVTSEDLRPGQWRELTADELVDLKKNYGVPKKVRAPSLDYTKGKAARGEGPAAKFEKQALRKGAYKKASARARAESRPDSRFSSRSEPQRAERGPSGRQSEPTRPWREQSTSHDRAPAPGHTRPGRAPVAVKKSAPARGPERRAQEKRNLRAERGAGAGQKKSRGPEPTARRDEPRFSRRRGTSR